MKAQDSQLLPPSSESLEAGYETSGVSVKALAWSIVVIAASAAIIHAGAWYIMAAFLKHEAAREQSHSALSDQKFITSYNTEHGRALTVSTPPPGPEPRIQPSTPHNSLPRQDLIGMYRSENQIFGQMGWKFDAENPNRLVIPRSVMDAVKQQANGRHK